jgi:UDP-N-acetylmuramoyl-tripeptide--D-alanyl-D-alanine ligase
MKQIIEKILAIFAKIIIKKYKPEIVAVTGSLGKTSTTNAIFAALSFEYNVRQNMKNYNNEIGLPLTIINAKSGGKNLFGWIKVFYKAKKLILLKDKEYPEVLVLEMGADMKGDIDYLINIAQPNIGVLTTVSETHLKPTNPKAKNEEVWFKDIKGVLMEKQKIVTRLSENGVAILNYDDENVISVNDKIQNKVITYGFSDMADVQAGEMLFTGLEQDFCETQHQWDCKVWGTSFKVNYHGSSVPVFLPHSFGKAQVYAALAAISVGIAKGMNLVDLADALRQYRPAKGRMNLIAGIKHSLIIDDTYNSPAARAVIAALEVIKDIDIEEGKRKIAILGDMLELGEKSEAAHREVGLKIAEFGIDYLITVGKNSLLTVDAAVEAGMNKENVHSFETAEKAGRFLQDIMQKGELVLVKGSQGMRMEKIVKEIMAEPNKAKELLVRQTGEWENR